MCNREICLNSNFNSANSSDDIFDSNHDFLTHLGHCKCKVVGLVRQQMKKLNSKSNKYSTPDTQIYHSSLDDGHNWSTERGVQTHKEVNEKATENESLATSFLPSFLLARQHFPQFENLYEYKKVVVASLVMLGVVWMALVLGALLGAAVCGDKRTCLPIFQLDSKIRSKHSLF